jgi:glycosyltransferase involved in cell wall biosynthesis
MGLLYILASVSFLILFFINVIWTASNLYLTINGQIELFLHGANPVENIYYSVYLKWILLADGLWILGALIFMLQRKHYKTDPTLHYLNYNPILEPIICVVIPAYNEASAIKKVVKDYLNQKFVKYVIVIDNNSTDNTFDIAEKSGAIVVRQKKNMGFAHSYVLGLNEALKTNSNIIATTESDDSFNAYDVKKMLPYLDNCDMVIGARQNQILTEKGNQNSLLHVWGNFFLAKLIQIKYFSLLHTGIVNLTDVGCVFRFIRRNALEKIVNDLTLPNSDKPIAGLAVTIHLTMLSIEKDLKIIEVPITFKKRIGVSKIGTNKKFHAIKVGLIFLWFILRYPN